MFRTQAIEPEYFTYGKFKHSLNVNFRSCILTPCVNSFLKLIIAYALSKPQIGIRRSSRNDNTHNRPRVH